MSERDTVFTWKELPAATADLAGTGGEARSRPEDFRVTEIPAYLPSGSGSHLYLYVRKRGHTTRDLVTVLRGAGVPDARIGVAGLKDKHAVTEQWLSLPWSMAGAADALNELPGVEILDRSRHRNKLGVGHLHGNRFEITLRGAEAGAAKRARAVLKRLAAGGVPNYFGPQRFGRFGRNVADGLRLLAGERVPGDRRLQRFFLASVQSWVFNRLLAERVREGSYATVMIGDWAKKSDTGGVFLVEDESEAERAARFEIGALIPLHGRKVRISPGEPGRREEAALAQLGLAWRDLVSRRGDRRLARIRVTDPRVEELLGVDQALRVAFTLPKGSYATTVLREVTKTPVDEPVPGNVSEGERGPDGEVSPAAASEAPTR